MKIKEVYESGMVRRWHQHPKMQLFNQNNASHQWNAAMLLFGLHPDPSRDLVFHVLTHDCGELKVGDLSRTSKDANPSMAASHAAWENEQRIEMLGSGEVSLTDEDGDWLYLVDKLESVLHVLVYHRSLLKSPTWREQVSEIRDAAGRLDVLTEVDGLLGEFYDAG